MSVEPDTHVHTLVVTTNDPRLWICHPGCKALFLHEDAWDLSAFMNNGTVGPRDHIALSLAKPPRITVLIQEQGA